MRLATITSALTLAFATFLAGASHADEPAKTPQDADLENDPVEPAIRRRAATQAALLPAKLSVPKSAMRDYDAPKPNRDAIDFARAGAHVLFANAVVFQFDWWTRRDYIYMTGADIKRNFKEGFEWDRDPLQTNFFGHPLHGSFYHTGARAAGLDFWESIPFSLGGSLMWEFMGENELPSANDLAATTLGGVFLGEAMHRVSSQILDDSRSGGARLQRELLATLIDPSRGFDRLLTGKAWQTGDRPVPRFTRVGFDVGVDRVRADNFTSRPTVEQPGPSLLAAAHVEYGDLLPMPGKETIGPLETFDLYAAMNLLRSEVAGAQVFQRGVLIGFSSNLSRDESPVRDNNVFGFFQTFDFQGANLATYGAAGFGPGDEIVLRSHRFGHLRLGAGLEWVPVLGVASKNTGSSVRTYNIATGGSGGLYAAWDLGKIGRLGLRSKTYVGSVVDGATGAEIISNTRASYEVDVIPNIVGLGLAPTFTARTTNYHEGPDQRGTQIATQFYMVVHTQ